jgi:hypothetical protein
VKKFNLLVKEMDLKDSNFQWILTGLCVSYYTAKLRKWILGELQNHIKKILDRIYTDYWGSFKAENLIDS